MSNMAVASQEAANSFAALANQDDMDADTLLVSGRTSPSTVAAGPAKILTNPSKILPQSTLPTTTAFNVENGASNGATNGASNGATINQAWGASTPASLREGNASKLKAVFNVLAALPEGVDAKKPAGFVRDVALAMMRAVPRVTFYQASCPTDAEPQFTFSFTTAEAARLAAAVKVEHNAKPVVLTLADGVGPTPIPTTRVRVLDLPPGYTMELLKSVLGKVYGVGNVLAVRPDYLMGSDRQPTNVLLNTAQVVLTDQAPLHKSFKLVGHKIRVADGRFALRLDLLKRDGPNQKARDAPAQNTPAAPAPSSVQKDVSAAQPEAEALSQSSPAAPVGETTALTPVVAAPTAPSVSAPQDATVVAAATEPAAKSKSAGRGNRSSASMGSTQPRAVKSGNARHNSDDDQSGEQPSRKKQSTATDDSSWEDADSPMDLTPLAASDSMA